MDPAAVIHVLGELKQERSGDLLLFEALSRRFASHVEEFFPPQICAVLESFAELTFSDDQLLQGLTDRLGDVVADASPKRIVRLLRSGATLRLRPEAWLGHVVPQLHKRLPALSHGIPSVLASLHALRWRDPQLAQLLLVQGMVLVKDGTLDRRSFARLFESWSRHALPGAEEPSEQEKAADELAIARARELAPSGALLGGGGKAIAQNEAVGEAAVASTHKRKSAQEPFDVAESLSLLAGLARRGWQGDVAKLEEHLALRVRAGTVDGALEVLSWMHRLSLRSALLWRACAELVELALKDSSVKASRPFILNQLPSAIHALASLSYNSQGEAALVAGLLSAPETLDEVPMYSAAQALQLLHAACLLCTPDRQARSCSPEPPWMALTTQTLRSARKLTLPERRTLSVVLEFLGHRSSGAPGDAELAERLGSAPLLPVKALPPLLGNSQEEARAEWLVLQTGAEALLRAADGPQERGVKFLGFGDVFTSTEALPHAPPYITPVCDMITSTLGLKGWQVDLRE